GRCILLASDGRGVYRGLDQFSGMSPPREATFWSLRVAMLGTVLMLALASCAWWRLSKVGGDASALSRCMHKALVAAAFGGWLVAFTGFAHIYLGAFPYAVAGTVTLNEVLTNTSVAVLLAGGVALLLVYALCMVGFLQLLWHNMRYGVVPVARHRGRA